MTKYITRDGLEKLKKEITELKTVKRKEIIEKIQKAKEMGDLSENAEYADAKEQQSFIEGRIVELENLINNAVIIEESGKSGQEIYLGTTVKILSPNNEQKEYKIVGSNEADPDQGLISNESPLGRAFLGKKTGDKVKVQTPKGEIEYTILEAK